MTQKEKELSFIDISGRLRYGVVVNYKENEYDYRKWKIDTLHALSYSREGTLINTDTDGWISYEEYKGCGMSTGSRPFRIGEVLPYLRPMSSMTEEECDMVEEILGDKCIFDFMNNGDIVLKQGQFSQDKLAKLYDYYNSIHVDYRGLIEKGLAIAVTKENNPYKE